MIARICENMSSQRFAAESIHVCLFGLQNCHGDDNAETKFLLRLLATHLDLLQPSELMTIHQISMSAFGLQSTTSKCSEALEVLAALNRQMTRSSSADKIDDESFGLFLSGLQVLPNIFYLLPVQALTCSYQLMSPVNEQ